MSERASLELLLPDWPAPANVHAIVTTRRGGISGDAYAELNLAVHVGDQLAAVEENRRRLCAALGVAEIQWLEQVHGATVFRAGCFDAARHTTRARPPVADAVWTMEPGVACAVLTADCLPVVVCDRAGTVAGIAHCGWRGLAAGVIASLLRALPTSPDRLIAWIGPGIGGARYEIGTDVANALSAVAGEAAARVLAASPTAGKWFAHLPALARAQLHAAGVGDVFECGLCTFDDERFFSHRRDGLTGRFATVVVLQAR